MENGYEILWTDYALDELNTKCVYFNSKNPYLIQESDFKQGVRKVVNMKFNSMYQVVEGTTEIHSFFSNRLDHNDLKL